MAKQKIDGVVQAVHYNPDGQIAWVRAFVRRGPTYSDRILIDRQKLVDVLKQGKHYFAGERVLQKASTFEVGEPVRVLMKDGREFLVTGSHDAAQDHLEGIPVL